MIRTFATIAFAMLLLSPLSAQTRPNSDGDFFYLTFKVMDQTINDEDLPLQGIFANQLGFVPQTLTFNDPDPSLHLTEGYQVNPYFAVEVGLDYWGELNILGEEGGNLYTLETQAYGLHLDLRGQYPVLDWLTVFGSVGGQAYQLNIDLAQGGSATSHDESGFDLRFGGGLSFKVHDQVHVELSYEQSDVEALEYTGVGLGVKWRY